MILIKIGGGKLLNWEYIVKDLVELVKTDDIIIVHGANAKRDEIAKIMNYETKKITSPSGVVSTFTDEKMIDIFLMSYAGLVNKRLVTLLQKNGLNAVGLSGIDGRIWEAKWKKNLFINEGGKEKLIRGSFTGKVEKVNVDLLNLLINNNYLPVLCPPAISYENEVVNTDNDWAAAVMIGALQIKTMISLFEAPGLLKNSSDESSLIKTINKSDIKNYLQFTKGTMKKKLLGAEKAFSLGLEKMYLGDGRIKNPITTLLNGNGTFIN